ncbi:MFS transporter [Chloroflexota bacterium]
MYPVYKAERCLFVLALLCFKVMREGLHNTATGDSLNYFRRLDYLKITIFGFAIAALWSSLHSIVLPLRLLDFVAESQKNTYLGLLTFAGLMLAMTVQPIAGVISDRSRFSWGRRRPYILLGTIATIVLLPGIGLLGSYAAIFIIYCLLQVSSNTAQGPYQAFIPDLVPEGKRGLASGVKSLLEITGGIALVRLVGHLMGQYATGETSPWLWLVLGILAFILLGAMVTTVLTVKEKPGNGDPQVSLFSALSRSFRIDIKTHPDFVLFLVSRLLIFMALATIQTFALYYLRDVIGVTNPATATADLLIAAGIGMLIAVYPAGRLSDRIGRRPVVISSGLFGALGILVIFFSPSYGYIIFGGAILGIATGAFMSSNWALATDLVARGEEARYLGLTNVATAGGAALSRLIGPVIDFFNIYTPGLGYQIMLGACFSYFIIGSLLLFKVKKIR